jgi:phosphorylcholine metabolism protein LicD
MAGKNKKREHLIFIFQYIMNFLSKANLTFILFYGSLLGYLRDGNFIDNDDDIDILMDKKDMDKLTEFLKF